MVGWIWRSSTLASSASFTVLFFDSLTATGTPMKASTTAAAMSFRFICSSGAYANRAILAAHTP